MRESSDVPCVECRRRGFSLEDCGPSLFGPERERKLSLARERGEHTLDHQNDVRTNDSAAGTASLEHGASAGHPDLVPELSAPFAFQLELEPAINHWAWEGTMAVDPEFEQSFLMDNFPVAEWEVFCDSAREPRMEHRPNEGIATVRGTS